MDRDCFEASDKAFFLNLGNRFMIGEKSSTCIPILILIATQSCLTLCNPWTVARWAPVSMEFSRREYWYGLPFSSPGDLPNPGSEPRSSALQAGSLPFEPPGKPFKSKDASQMQFNVSLSYLCY